MISYDYVTRIETYPLPKAAVREAVYRSIISNRRKLSYNTGAAFRKTESL